MLVFASPLHKLTTWLRRWIAESRRGTAIVQELPPVHARPPGRFDDASRDYAAGDAWSVPGDTRVWYCTDNRARRARWHAASLDADDVPPRAMYGTKRLCARHAGPLVKVVNPLTGVETDIGFTDKNGIDEAGLLSAMAGALFLQVAVVYDQSGNGNHAVQAHPTARPAIKPGPLQTGHCISLIFDPPTGTAGRFLNIPETLCWPVDTPSSQLAVASFQSWSSSNTQISALATAGDGQERAITWASIHNEFYVAKPDNTNLPISWPHAPRLPISRFVTGYVATPEATEFWVNNVSLALPRGFCPTIAGGVLGAASTPAGGGMQLSALAIYDRALTSWERRVANAAMYRHFGVAPQIRDTIICDGDSITWGFGATFNETWPGQLAARLDGRYVVASSGACGSEAIERVAQTLTPGVLKLWFPATRAKNILVFFADTNDLVAGRTAHEIYEAHTRLVELCRFLGIRIILVTILPRQGFPAAGSPPGSMETERLNLNTLIKTNTAGADGIADVAGHPRLHGLSDDIGEYFPDGVHPASFPTCSLIASVVADTISRV